jgi:CHAT domain-containing protein
VTRIITLLLAVFAAAVDAQQVTPLRSALAGYDSTALIGEVRRRPAAARDLLVNLVAQAGSVPANNGDSILGIAHRLASAYSAVWDDSFPVSNLNRFTAMSAPQRAAKVRADSVRRAGNLAFGTKGAATAINIWRDALRRSRAIPDSAGVAAAIGNIGSAFYNSGELDSAEEYLTRARRLAEAIGDRRTAANAIGSLASVAKDRGNLRQAQGAYALALALRTRIGDVEGQSADHNNLGLIAAAVGDEDQARTHYTDALRIARDNNLDGARATALLNLGNLGSDAGAYEQASKYYLEALALSRALGIDADAALALHNLGLLALRMGDYSVAQERLRQALQLFVHAGTPEDLVQIRRDLASAESAMGNMRAALIDLRRAEELVARIPRSYGLAASVALAQADLAVSLNDYADADRKYTRAQALYRQAGDARGEIQAREGRAALLIQRQEYSAGEAQLEAVMRAQLAASDRRSAAITRLALGRAHQEGGDTAAARQLMRQALDSLHALRDGVAQAAVFLALGDLEFETGSPLAAQSEYRKGLAVMRSQAPAVSWQLHAGLGRALHSIGSLTDAASELRLAIADVERVTRTLPSPERRSVFLADKFEPYAQLALLERERGNSAAAFLASERMRARQMLEQLALGAVNRPATVDTAIVTHEQGLRARIAGLTQRLEPGRGTTGLRGFDLSDTSTGVTREALAATEEEYAHVLVELNDDRITPTTAAAMPDWRSFAAHVGRDQALLEYLVTDSTTLVFVVKSDTIQTLDLGVGRSALAALVDFARGTLVRTTASGSTEAWRAPLRRLYAQLLAPVEQSGLLDNVRRLVIIPHGELHYLPFAALVRNPGRVEFLVERYDIAYAPSALLWLQLGDRGSLANNSVLALAPRTKTLPGSKGEVEVIRSLYGADATVLVDADATEDAFRASAPRFGIIHLATNGVLNRHNPLFSFVELTADPVNDGRLEVREVFGVPLHARLVVLSACQTALGSGAISDVPAGDDWVGLSRAFLGAGAQQVIASLWAVEDQSTASLMKRLHVHIRSGEAVARALSEAQRETLRNSATASPFYWAGFVLVGGA